MNNPIHLLTVQNTGTWFFIQWLYGHPNVDAFCETMYIDHLLSGRPKQNNLGGPDKIITQNLTLTGTQLYHTHLFHAEPENRWLSAILTHNKVIFTVRDPILSLISLNNWRERQGLAISLSDVTIRLNAFRMLIHYYNLSKQLPSPPIFISVDNPQPDPITALTTAEASLSLPPTDYTIQYAEKWAPMNVHPAPTSLKGIYLEDGPDAFSSAFKYGKQALSFCRDEAQEFYTSLNYNLPWFK